MQRLLQIAVAICASVALLGVAQASPITAGDLVFLRVGDGTTTVTSAAMNVSLMDYTVNYTAGIPTSLTYKQQIDLGTTATGSGNRAATLLGNGAAEGQLLLSTDGNYMTFGAYNTTAGAALVSADARVFGRLELSTFTADTTTAVTGLSSNLRGVASTDGTKFWGASSSQGVRYVSSLGATSSTALNSTGVERHTGIFGGQLYVSRASGGNNGISTLGTGLPTTSGQTATELTGMPTANSSPYDFWFADANTLYVADDRVASGTGTTAGGLEKWTLSAGTWTRQYIKNLGTNNGIRNLHGFVDGSGNVTMFATTTWLTGTGNQILGLTDTLSNTSDASVTSNVLLDATTDFGVNNKYSLRGLVALAPVPEPASLGLLAISGLLMLRRRSA